MIFELKYVLYFKGIQNPQIMVFLAWPDSGTFGEFRKYT